MVNGHYKYGKYIFSIQHISKKYKIVDLNVSETFDFLAKHIMMPHCGVTIEKGTMSEARSTHGGVNLGRVQAHEGVHMGRSRSHILLRNMHPGMCKIATK